MNKNFFSKFDKKYSEFKNYNSLFKFHDEVVILIFTWTPEQGGNIN